jgi:hypothetical protein
MDQLPWGYDLFDALILPHIRFLSQRRKTLNPDASRFPIA